MAQKIRIIFPWIASLLTGRVRYIPDIEWRSRNWTHNAFRVFELIFGRSFGKNGIGDTIRAETVEYGTQDRYGRKVCVRRFYTWEALLSHVESRLRAFLKTPEWGFEFVPIPQLAMPNGVQMPTLPPIFSYAIAFVNSASSRPSAGSSITVSHDASTSNLILCFLTNWQNSSDVFTGVTFNGNALTRITGASGASMGGAHYDVAYYITGQTGTHNLVASFSGSTDVWYVIMTYSGTDQAGGVIQTSNANLSESSATSQTVSITSTSHANSWAVSYSHTAGETITGFTTGTRRDTTNGYFQGADSNGTITASASYSAVWSAGASTQWFTSVLQIQPAQSTTYNQTVTATTAMSALILTPKTILQALTGTTAVTSSMTLVKQFVRTLTGTAVVTASALKGLTMALTATTVTTASMTAERVFLVALTAITAVTGSLTKVHNYARTLAGTAAVTASIAKQLTLSVALTATTEVTGVLDKVRQITLTASTAVTASVAVAIGKSLTATTSIIAKIIAPFWKTKYPAHGDGEDYEIKYPHE